MAAILTSFRVFLCLKTNMYISVNPSLSTYPPHAECVTW